MIKNETSLVSVWFAYSYSFAFCLLEQVQQGDSLTASVQVLDKSGKPLPASHFEQMDLKTKLDIPSRSYITVTPIQSLDPHTALYTVKGVELGTARLMFTALAQRGALITSNIENIQVSLV